MASKGSDGKMSNLRCVNSESLPLSSVILHLSYHFTNFFVNFDWSIITSVILITVRFDIFSFSGRFT